MDIIGHLYMTLIFYIIYYVLKSKLVINYLLRNRKLFTMTLYYIIKVKIQFIYNKYVYIKYINEFTMFSVCLHTKLY